MIITRKPRPLTKSMKTLLRWLADVYANTPFDSAKKFADELHLSERTFTHAINRLKDLGLIKLRHRKKVIRIDIAF